MKKGRESASIHQKMYKAFLRGPVRPEVKTEKSEILPHNDVKVQDLDTADLSVVLGLTVSGSRDHNLGTDSVNGVTFLPDGRLLLCDGATGRHRLVLLDRNFRFRRDVALPSKPGHISAVSDREAVVCLPTQGVLQFVTVEPDMALGKTVSLNRNCVGLDIVRRHIYVVYPNEVYVINLEGHLVRSIQLCMINGYVTKTVRFAKISPKSDRIFVSNDDGVTCFSPEGQQLCHVTLPRMSHLGSLYVDEEDNVVVCDTSAVHVVDSHGTVTKLLVSDIPDTDFRFVTYRPADGSLLVVHSNHTGHTGTVYSLQR